MKSPYGNPWLRKPYANARMEAAKADAVRRKRALMTNIAIWSAAPATLMVVIAAFSLR